MNLKWSETTSLFISTFLTNIYRKAPSWVSRMPKITKLIATPHLHLQATLTEKFIRWPTQLTSVETLVRNLKNPTKLPTYVPVNKSFLILARESANSHYIFPSDIELYPNPGLIPMFLDMITRGGETALKRKNPRIFVSSIFEIKEGNELPNTKAELIDLLNKKVVIPFHKMVCSQCHAIPKAKEWLTDPISGNLYFF